VGTAPTLGLLLRIATAQELLQAPQGAQQLLVGLPHRVHLRMQAVPASQLFSSQLRESFALFVQNCRAPAD
jgi:hypothetical protein